MPKKLRDIMTTSVETVMLKDNVYEAAVKMKESDVGIIPVVDEDRRCIGLLTDRDIVVRGVAEKKPNSSAIGEIMSKRLITGRPDMTVDEASQVMAKEQIKRLPVIENDKLVGMVALADLSRNRETSDEAGFVVAELSETLGMHLQEPNHFQ
ncbi:CBS domain-containing protein [Aneurinibacillus sp. Ricciae_BoGa-3]|uniref:CBS domain-containing protein n=1 Tax=Aneurinibacillus sp. Ricciae_BoGa-3 TaxID=3022697 RepID=UPI0023416AA0|nr:CBS domain-containing protein [Aneurinibacillus sp. Ricciae_BoGa-3]WCK53362.1 CBS domain-containing protein [Aneurinibacillus sp. Ricciae_BoGa-3]